MVLILLYLQCFLAADLRLLQVLIWMIPYAKAIILLIKQSKSFNNKTMYGFNLTSAAMFFLINGACHIWQDNISVIRHFQIPLFFRRATPPAVFVTEP